MQWYGTSDQKGKAPLKSREPRLQQAEAVQTESGGGCLHKLPYEGTKGKKTRGTEKLLYSTHPNKRPGLSSTWAPWVESCRVKGEERGVTSPFRAVNPAGAAERSGYRLRNEKAGIREERARKNGRVFWYQGGRISTGINT